MNLPAQYAEGSTDLQVLIDKIRENRWWILASIVLSTALFTTAALVIKPVYRASTVLISASAERNSISSSLNSALGQFDGLASLAGVNLGASDAGTEEALAVLRSRQFTERFIAETNLMPELFAARWDAARGQWKSPEGQPTPAKAFNYFKGIRTITQNKKTGLVTLQIDWQDLNKATAWANELMQRLNFEMRKRAIEQAEASLRFLDQELAATPAIETREAINRLVEAKIKQRMLANITHEYAFRVIEKGWIKVGNFTNSRNKSAYAYLLTPRGLERKATLTVRFLQLKIREYETLRAQIKQMRRETKGVDSGLSSVEVRER